MEIVDFNEDAFPNFVSLLSSFDDIAFIIVSRFVQSVVPNCLEDGQVVSKGLLS